jgi:O-antigen ligase
LAVLLNHEMAWGKRVLFALAVIIGCGGLLASFSRSNWMATLVGVFVILWLSGKVRYFFILLFGALLSILALKEFVPFAEYIFERFTSIFTLFEQFGSVGRTSSTARIYLITASFDMFADHPLLGIGWRAFPFVFSNYAPPGFPHWSQVNEPHTVITMVLGELGIVGFAAMLWFLLKVFFLSMSRFRQMQDNYLRAVQIGMIATFVAFQVNQSFNGDLANNMFWFGIGMLFAVQRIDREGRSSG